MAMTVRTSDSSCHRASIYDRRQEGSRRFIVKILAHQRHRLNDTQSPIQAPTKKLCIAAWNEQARSGDAVCRADQRLHIIIGFTDCMAEGTNQRRVPCNPTIMLDHTRGLLLNRLEEFVVTLVTM